MNSILPADSLFELQVTMSTVCLLAPDGNTGVGSRTFPSTLSPVFLPLGTRSKNFYKIPTLHHVYPTAKTSNDPSVRFSKTNMSISTLARTCAVQDFGLCEANNSHTHPKTKGAGRRGERIKRGVSCRTSSCTWHQSPRDNMLPAKYYRAIQRGYTVPHCGSSPSTTWHRRTPGKVRPSCSPTCL